MKTSTYPIASKVFPTAVGSLIAFKIPTATSLTCKIKKVQMKLGFLLFGEVRRSKSLIERRKLF